jgi:hypothetical protein
MDGALRVEAAQGLELAPDAEGDWRLAWGFPDWLGPIALRVEHAGKEWVGRAGSADAVAHPVSGEDALGAYRGVALTWDSLPLPLAASVRAYRDRPLLVFRCEALEAIAGLATGRLARPSVAWPWARPGERASDGLPGGARAFGHQYTEFGLPSFSGPDLAGFFLLGERPAVVEPLFLLAPDASGERCLLLVPQDAFHDQVIAVPRGAARAAEGLRWGWHGDLDAVPAGFASELAVWAGPGPRRLLETWAAHQRERHGTRRLSRYADDAVGRLSYWTDNGAAYWYRSEPGLDLPTTLERTLTSLREERVPVRAVELDSWFYPHHVLRPLNAPEIDVPPTGCIAWEPRADALPQGVHGLRSRMGDPPLILHGRHFSSESPYFALHEGWLDGDRAHPAGPELWDALLGQAAGWGAIQYEQDWLVESFLGVRGLRERPGRARAWQEGLDAAAGEHGLTLLWCMATPADFFQTVTLRNLAAIRTSGDYRYVIGNASLWCWFLYGNALARALGLFPFKDVFLSSPEGADRDGDPCAEAEAMLAALSAGPVGIGDRLGRTRRDIVLRTCRADGLLVKPDLPIAPLERCYRGHPHLEPIPLVGETRSRHPAGTWSYVASLHAWRGEEPLRFRVDFSELGDSAPAGEVVAYDWRTGAFQRCPADGGLELELAPRDWNLRVLCPVLPGGIALFGDPSKYACAGDRRLRGIRSVAGGVELDVLGAPGEVVELRGWSRGPVAGVRLQPPQAAEALGLERDAASGGFQLRVDAGARGWARIRIEAR